MNIFSIISSAIVGGLLGAMGALWWGINFASNLDKVDPHKNQEWRFMTGRVYAKAFGIGCLFGIIEAVWQPHQAWKIGAQSFEFFVVYSLPPLVITWALGSRQLLRYLRQEELPSDYKEFAERNYPKPPSNDE